MSERTITIRGTEHATPHDAQVELNFSGDRAITLGGRHFTIDDDEYHRLERDGIEPDVWYDHAASGRIVCVPGRHGVC